LIEANVRADPSLSFFIKWPNVKADPSVSFLIKDGATKGGNGFQLLPLHFNRRLVVPLVKKQNSQTII